MNWTCENCEETFSVQKHERATSTAEHGEAGMPCIVRGTGQNVAYIGLHDKEYVVCPRCGVLQNEELT